MTIAGAQADVEKTTIDRAGLLQMGGGARDSLQVVWSNLVNRASVCFNGVGSYWL